ncbi:hypothetical protein [Aquipuribacter hungaricus]|uniref:Bulb-type lectin domain-containing protein n=1 Tax=Aquipuribacter hungaricus TaxID=545624 RepID=A0ABV7WLV0_9MICO
MRGRTTRGTHRGGRTTLRRLTAVATGTVLLATGLATAPAASADRLDTLLTVGERLERGDSLATADGRIRLQLDHVGGLKLVDRGAGAGYPGERVVRDYTTNQHTVRYVELEADGTLVGYDDGGSRVVEEARGSGAVAVRVQDDRNMVYTDTAGRPVFSTDSHRNLHVFQEDFLVAGDTVLGERQASRLVMQADGNLVLYRGQTPLWSSETSGNPGAFAVMQGDGNLVVYSAPASGPRRALFDTGSGFANEGDHVELVVEDTEVSVKIRYGRSGAFYPMWSSGRSSDRVAAGDELDEGDIRVSPDGRCVLFTTQVGFGVGCGEDGYATTSPTVATRAGALGVTRMQSDGNLVSYRFPAGGSQPSDVPFHTGTSTPGSFLVVQDDGNAVVVGPDGRPTWSLLTGRIS